MTDFFHFDSSEDQGPNNVSYKISAKYTMWLWRKKLILMVLLFLVQGPVVQSMVSLTSSLRGQLVKCFTTLGPNTLNIFDEKMREAFALQKLLSMFQQKLLANFRY